MANSRKSPRVNQIGSVHLVLLVVITALLVTGIFLLFKTKTTSKTSESPKISLTERSAYDTSKLRVVADPNKVVLASSVADPCQYLEETYTNVRTIFKEVNIGSGLVTLCESYSTSKQMCYVASDKAAANPKPCEDSSNGPYNQIYAYMFSPDAKAYESVYLALDDSILPDSMQRDGGYWIMRGRRYKNSVPDLETRKIDSLPLYRYSASDVCGFGIACTGSTEETVYLKMSEELIVEIRYYTQVKLRGIGG